jgi:hypothetical protein
MMKNRVLATSMNHRLPALLGLLASGILGALSRSFGLPGFWAKYLGVVFWACAAYFVVRAARPSQSARWSLLSALIISWAVELAQLTPLPRTLSAKHWLLRVAFGETFSVWDLPAYAVGVVLAFGVEKLVRAKLHLGSAG